jgi:hypothetical protein
MNVPVMIVAIPVIAIIVVSRHRPVVRPGLIVTDMAWRPDIDGRFIHLHALIYRGGRDPNHR